MTFTYRPKLLGKSYQEKLNGQRMWHKWGSGDVAAEEDANGILILKT
jgi:hypothetical protein